MIDKTNAHTEAANATARSRKSALVLIIGAIVLVALVVGV